MSSEDLLPGDIVSIGEQPTLITETQPHSQANGNRVRAAWERVLVLVPTPHRSLQGG